MKALTIAFATAKEAIRQPAFFVMAFFAAALLIVTIFVSYFTFGEDIKMYKDTGLTTISFFCMLLALLDGELDRRRRDRGQDGDHAAVEADQPPAVHHRQVPGDRAGRAGALRRCWGRCSRRASGTSTPTTCAKRRRALPNRPKQWAQVMQVIAWAGARLLRGDRPDQHQRGDLDPAADAGQPGRLHPDLLPRPPEPGAGRGGRAGPRERAGHASWPSCSPRSCRALEFFNAGPSISTGAVIPWIGYVLPAFGYCMLYSGAALVLAFLLFEDRDLA